MVIPQRYAIALFKIVRQNQLVESTGTIQGLHLNHLDQFLPISSLYTITLALSSTPSPISIYSFTYSQYKLTHVHFKFILALHSYSHCSLYFTNTTGQVTEPESKLWQVCELNRNSLSRSRVFVCVHMAIQRP